MASKVGKRLNIFEKNTKFFIHQFHESEVRDIKNNNTEPNKFRNKYSTQFCALNIVKILHCSRSSAELADSERWEVGGQTSQFG